MKELTIAIVLFIIYCMYRYSKSDGELDTPIKFIGIIGWVTLLAVCFTAVVCLIIQNLL